MSGVDGFGGRLLTATWSVVKLVVAALTGPVWSTAIALRASMNHHRARGLANGYPRRLRALASGARPAGPANRRTVVPAEITAFISSDLHRCIEGRLDHPRRLGTTHLYEAALAHYAARGDHLIENGDVEDYWMMGGNAAGTRYDMARTFAGPLPGALGRRVRSAVRRSHLDRIVENNLTVYRQIRDGFADHGRYWRTIGNHDDVFSVDPPLRQHLRRHLPGADPTDHIVLVDRRGVTRAIVTHGHQTDGWNAPRRANLGRLASWAANTLTDIPFVDTPEGLPSPAESAGVLDGAAPNRLVSVNPRFGANRHYDSLDEEELFAAVGPHLDEPPRPWLLLGHTHFPVYEPRSRTGATWRRYANSGTALLWGVLTGLEWDGTGDEPVVRLVAWHWADASTPEENVVTTVNDRRVARTELVAGEDAEGRSVVGPAHRVRRASSVPPVGP